MIFIAYILILFGFIGLYSNYNKNLGYTFFIDYDNHYSSSLTSIWLPRFLLKKEKKLRFTTKFNKSCLYEIHGKDRDDINKLYGFSEGYHMETSLRIGWRGIDGFIELFTYIHQFGEITVMESLGRYDVDTLFIITLQKCSSLYHVEVNGVHKTYVRYGEDIKFGWFSYILKPYFGGNKTAPKDMYIEIKEL